MTPQVSGRSDKSTIKACRTLASYTKSLETLGSFTTGVKPPGSFVRTEVYISGWVCLFSSQSWAFGVPGRGLFKNAM
jgi:hypothetical protein